MSDVKVEAEKGDMAMEKAGTKDQRLNLNDPESSLTFESDL